MVRIAQTAQSAVWYGCAPHPLPLYPLHDTQCLIHCMQVKAAMVDSANESVARLRAALAVAEREGAEAAAARAEARTRGAEEDAQLQRLRCAVGDGPCSRSEFHCWRRPRGRWSAIGKGDYAVPAPAIFWKRGHRTLRIDLDRALLPDLGLISN